MKETEYKIDRKRKIGNDSNIKNETPNSNQIKSNQIKSNLHMSARWYLECGAHVDLGNGHGCYRPGGIYWWNQWRKDVKSWMKVEKLSLIHI